MNKQNIKLSDKLKKLSNSRGFTIVELLVVIVVIGILAAVTIVSYIGISQSARDARRVSDIRSVSQIIEEYNAQNGTYPSTGGTVYSDSNCGYGTKNVNWVPNVVPSLTSSLPQSFGPRPNGRACYEYWSDGTNYVVSAWLANEEKPQTSSLFSYWGFREDYYANQDGLLCISSTSVYSYLYPQNYVQNSYTISNMPNDCSFAA